MESQWRHPMLKYFEDIAGVRSYSPFGNITAEQAHCAAYVTQNHRAIQTHKSRDLYLKKIMNAIEGNSEADQDEPMTENAFSQYRFHKIFAIELVYFPDKFDFLTMCVEKGVCVVRNMFLTVMYTLVTPPPVRTIPTHVVHYEDELEADEVARIDSFTLRKDW
eukprot:PhF_6_TR41570/c0_g1_i3/m.62983